MGGPKQTKSNEQEFFRRNCDAWNAKTPVHLESDFYDVDGFLETKSSLNSIELELLGDITGKSVLHLQCHFGMDTLSLAQRGASHVVGIDFSDKAIEAARDLQARASIPNAEFICCNVYDTIEHVSEQFDIVYASYGTIGWLPDLKRWARVIAAVLKPGGTFVFAEFHPVLWMYDDDLKRLQYSYFNVAPIEEEMDGTYADPTAPIKSQLVGWNHPTADVITNLLGAGMRLTSYAEFDYSPYSCFPNMHEVKPGKHRVIHWGDKVPLVFSLTAQRD